MRTAGTQECVFYVYFIGFYHYICMYVHVFQSVCVCACVCACIFICVVVCACLYVLTAFILCEREALCVCEWGEEVVMLCLTFVYLCVCVCVWVWWGLCVWV